MTRSEYCVYEASYCGFCAYIGSGVMNDNLHISLMYGVGGN